ncbi:prolipoprotein diacylglyceryl transferase family protein [Bdellovibrionota bacterium FG-1]
MITYSPIPSLHLFGNVSLHPFGLLVATGVISGAALVHRRAKELKIPRDHVDGMIHWAVVPGFIGAHLFEMFFYQTDRLMQDGPLELLKFWDGISSYGGFIGAILGLFWYYRTTLKKGILIYTDLLLQGLVLGWVFGRLGCTIAFDHPGSITNFALAFEQDGVGRHNLGFYEFIFTLVVLLPTTLWIHHKKLKAGYQTVAMALLYAPVRFILDLFRATDKAGSDTRYLGLTFAHYVSLAVAAFGIWLWIHLRATQSDASARAP